MLNVKELRSKYGLSQEQFSELTGIPRGRINAWEQRGGEPIKSADIKAIERTIDKLENKSINNDKNVPRENKYEQNGTFEEMKAEYEKRLEEKERVILANETTIFVQTERIKELKEMNTELKERIRILERSLEMLKPIVNVK